MKTKALLFAALLLLNVKMKAQAVGDSDEKAFKKGNFVIQLGGSMGGYATSIQQEFDSAYWDGTSIQTARAVHNDSDGAVSFILPLTLEYGLTNWLGLGAKVGYCKYLGQDSSSSYTNKVSSIDLDGLVNLHFIKSKHFDMPLSINVGYSIFSDVYNDPQASTAKDKGINFGIGLNPRIYFGEHFGMHFDLRYASYVYPSITFSDNTDPNLNDNSNTTFSLKGKGLNFGLGFQYKF